MKGIKKEIADLETRNKVIKIADKSPCGWKTVEEYLSDSIASDCDDERKLGQRNRGRLGKNKNSRKPYCYNNIYSATLFAIFNYRFRNVQQIQFPTQHSLFPANYQRQQKYFKPYLNSSNHQSTTMSTGRSNPSAIRFACGPIGHRRSNCPYVRNLRRWSRIFWRLVYFFVIFSFYPWWFWDRLSQLWFWHFKKQSERKRELTEKFKVLASYRRKSFCYWYYRERLRNSIFHYSRFNFFQNNQSALQNANYITCTVKELSKSGRIKETRAPPYIVSPLSSIKVFQWFYNNGIKANIYKCHFLSGLDVTSTMTENFTIQNSASQKLLGITIDDI